MSEQDLDLSSSLRALRRRRALVAGLGIVGIAGGLGYNVYKPAWPSAKALVLLPSAVVQAQGTPAPDVNTQVDIAASAPVLADALKVSGVRESVTRLRDDTTVTAISQNVLSIKVEDHDGRTAERLANAVAASYVKYVSTTGATSTSTSVSGLSAQAAALNKQSKSIQKEITALTAKLGGKSLSPAARAQDETTLGQLENDQSAVSLQLNTIDAEVVQAQLNGSLESGTVRVLQGATTFQKPSILHVVELAGIGLAAGLLAGILLALAAGGRDQRLFRRSELASAIGVPVLASVSTRRCKSPSDWNRLLERAQPAEQDAWNLLRILRHIGATEADLNLEMQMVAFAEDRAAQATVAQLAAYAARSGITTALVAAGDPPISAMRAACGTSERPARPDGLTTYDSEETRAAGPEALLTLVGVAVNRDRPRLGTVSKAPCIVAVSSGFATPDDLAGVALACADAGVPVDGIVVVNPEDSDSSTGDEHRPRRRPKAPPRPATPEAPPAQAQGGPKLLVVEHDTPNRWLR